MKARVPEETLDNYPKVGVHRGSKPMRDLKEAVANQGSPLSPLLSNIVLDELDKELEKRGLNFVRYADDFVIYLKSRKAAVRVMSSISKFITNKVSF